MYVIWIPKCKLNTGLFPCWYDYLWTLKVTLELKGRGVVRSITFVTCEVLAALLVGIQVLLDLTPSGLVNGYRRLRGTCCFDLQGQCSPRTVTWTLRRSSCLYIFLMNGFQDALKPLWLYIIISLDDWRECWKWSQVCSICRETVRKTTEMIHWYTRRYETGVQINRLTYHEQRSIKPVGVYSNIHLGMRLPSFIMNVVRCL